MNEKNPNPFYLLPAIAADNGVSPREVEWTKKQKFWTWQNFSLKQPKVLPVPVKITICINFSSGHSETEWKFGVHLYCNWLCCERNNAINMEITSRSLLLLLLLNTDFRVFFLPSFTRKTSGKMVGCVCVCVRAMYLYSDFMDCFARIHR